MVASFSFEHDFEAFPELSNKQLSNIGFMSPHIQIERDFNAVVTKVHDGDTVTLTSDFRDFDFPLRLAGIDTPELNTGSPGEEARDWLLDAVEGQDVTIRIDPDNRVGKFGRLIGDIVLNGISMGSTMVQLGLALPFDQRREGIIPDINKEINIRQWLG